MPSGAHLSAQATLRSVQFKNRTAEMAGALVKVPISSDGNVVHLHHQERAMLRNFASARRDSFIAGRLAAKLALKLRSATPLHRIGSLSSIAILPNVLGAPFISAQDTELCLNRISISHSGGEAVALATPVTMPAAIDCQSIQCRISEALAELLQPGEEDYITYFYARNDFAACLWSIKEALAKVLGTGIGIDPRILAISALSRIVGNEMKVEFANLPCYRGIAFREKETWIGLVYPSLYDISLAEERRCWFG